MKRLLLSAALLSAMALPGVFAQNEGKIQTRDERQQQRIGQGVENGTLTPNETIKLEKKDRKINREVRNDRKANGGKLTAAEKKRVNRQQNKVSQQIYNEKHDGPKQ